MLLSWPLTAKFKLTFLFLIIYLPTWLYSSITCVLCVVKTLQHYGRCLKYREIENMSTSVRIKLCDYNFRAPPPAKRRRILSNRATKVGLEKMLSLKYILAYLCVVGLCFGPMSVYADKGGKKSFHHYYYFPKLSFGILFWKIPMVFHF